MNDIEITDKQKKQARVWCKKHSDHVIDMVFSIESEEDSYPPSKEDINYPELGKAEHWSWFFLNHF